MNPKFSCGDKILLPTNDYFISHKLAGANVQVISITDNYYLVWSVRGNVKLTIEQVNQGTKTN